MSIIVAIKSSRGTVVAADSQRNSPPALPETPYDRTFKINSVIGAFAGLTEFAGLDVKQHISNALYAKDLCPHDSMTVLELHIGPILLADAEDDASFAERKLDIIVASRNEIAMLRFWPNPQQHQIETQRRLNQIWLVAGSPIATYEAARRLSKLNGRPFNGKVSAVKVTQEIVESSIAACESHARYHPCKAQCMLPVSLRTV